MLHKRTLAGFQTALIMATLLLVACADDPAQRGSQTSRLPPCSAEGSVFAERPFTQWRALYHTNVSKVVDAHLRDINRVNTLKLQCTADSYSELLPASIELRTVAQMIPQWRQIGIAKLTEADMSSVLLEFLRVYECSMNEREEFLSVLIPREQNRPLQRDEFNKLKEADVSIMNDERLIARPTLNRTLSLVGGYDRLRPLALDIECIKRASLDLRNVLGLAADASACLPRIWDAKQSLRDLAP